MGIARKSLQTFVTQCVGLAASVLAAILVARLAGPSGRGELSAAMLVPTLVMQLLGLYMAGSVIYWLAQAKHDDRALLGTANSLMAAVGLAGFAGYVLFVLVAQNAITRNAGRADLLLAGLVIPLNLIASPWQGALQSREIVWPGNVRSVIGSTLALAIFLALALGGTHYVRYAILAQVAAQAAGVAFLLWASLRVYPCVFRWSKAALKDLLAYGVCGHLATVFALLVQRIDMWFVIALWGATELGYYAVAVQFAELLWFVPRAIGTLLFPRAARAGLEEAAATTAKGSRHSMLTTSAGALIYLVAGRWMIEILFGRSFLPAYQAMAILLPGVVLNASGDSLAAYLAGRGRIRAMLLVSFVACLVNLALNFTLIPAYGIVGAAWATTISYGCAWIMVLVLFLRSSRLPLREAVWPKWDDLQAYRRLLLPAAGLAPR